MLAICKREFKSYFQTMTGYMVIAFLLIVVGIYFTYYNLSMGYADISYPLSYSLFIFLLIIPVLTMKVFAEEKKQKTDQLLFTSPLPVWKVVAGKYLGMVGVLIIPVVIISTYPLILSIFGEVTLATAYVSLLGYFLYGAAGIAVGMFVSSVTESQVIAAVVTFAILLISNLMSGIASLISSSSAINFIGISILWLLICYIFYCMNKNIMAAGIVAISIETVFTILYITKGEVFTGIIASLMGVLGLQDQIAGFINNILDLKAVVYYLSVILFFLFVTIQSIQKRRWS